MKKDEVVRTISTQTGLPREDVSLALRGFFSVVSTSLVRGEGVYFRGFGSFQTRKRARKIARDIGRNTAILVAARQVPFFKPSKFLLQQVRESGPAT